MHVVAHDTLDSTNAEALRLSRSGESGPLWVTARSQSAGRGRRGRAWISEAGNLYASLLLSDPAPLDRWPELSFVAGLAVHDAITALAPKLGPHVSLKWPNDVLVQGKKAAGILIEAEAMAVVIGIGVNCVSHPTATSYPATNLKEAGVAITSDNLLEALSIAMQKRLAQWDRGGGFAQVRRDWLAHASGVGDAIRVRVGDRDLVGRFQELDPMGHLRLALPGGAVETIAAGDVFPLPTMSAI